MTRMVPALTSRSIASLDFFSLYLLNSWPEMTNLSKMCFSAWYMFLCSMFRLILFLQIYRFVCLYLDRALLWAYCNNIYYGLAESRIPHFVTPDYFYIEISFVSLLCSLCSCPRSSSSSHPIYLKGMQMDHHLERAFSSFSLVFILLNKLFHMQHIFLWCCLCSVEGAIAPCQILQHPGHTISHYSPVLHNFDIDFLFILQSLIIY